MHKQLHSNSRWEMPNHSEEAKSQFDQRLRLRIYAGGTSEAYKVTFPGLNNNDLKSDLTQTKKKKKVSV